VKAVESVSSEKTDHQTTIGIFAVLNAKMQISGKAADEFLDKVA
jgi:hypothetical protein